jgi:hypothetical protein
MTEFSEIPLFPKFDQIFIALHVRNDADISQAEKRKDPFAKLKTLFSELNQSFISAFLPSQPLAIDEQTIAFKWRHKAKQYNK